MIYWNCNWAFETFSSLLISVSNQESHVISPCAKTLRPKSKLFEKIEQNLLAINVNKLFLQMTPISWAKSIKSSGIYSSMNSSPEIDCEHKFLIFMHGLRSINRKRVINDKKKDDTIIKWFEQGWSHLNVRNDFTSQISWGESFYLLRWWTVICCFAKLERWSLTTSKISIRSKPKLAALD